MKKLIIIIINIAQIIQDKIFNEFNKSNFDLFIHNTPGASLLPVPNFREERSLNKTYY